MREQAMKIIGGFYGERMMHPTYDALYGSGLRAAAALAVLCNDVELFTYAAFGQEAELSAIADTFGLRASSSRRSQSIEFDYLHGSASPELIPDFRNIEQCEPIVVTSDIVVRFGMLEGSGITNANWAIFDPQTEVAPEAFHANGSTANHLALVLNEKEAFALSKATDLDSAAKVLIRLSPNTKAVVIKCDVRGALVCTEKQSEWVHPYKTASVFTIGSGDIFTAAFAFQWAVQQRSPVQAAEFASLATAFYCANRFLPLPKNFEEITKKQYKILKPKGIPGQIYIAAPFFSLGERWVVEQLRTALFSYGFHVFSPFHDVGIGSPEVVAPADLKGLRESSVVLACVDGMDAGTVFEVGYARARDIPVVALSTVPRRLEDLTMIIGSDCVLVQDIASAVYQTAWILAEQGK
ncbi:MAG: nucleoside 2-deoxyribosyltransferase [Proteobacteria bacterium]|nr:MAG: nucleoside 2-deoxyribosyltransferase [Pseudomonadota bacterium]